VAHRAIAAARRAADQKQRRKGRNDGSDRKKVA
jgi:hypothetical protein